MSRCFKTASTSVLMPIPARMRRPAPTAARVSELVFQLPAQNTIWTAVTRFSMDIRHNAGVAGQQINVKVYDKKGFVVATITVPRGVAGSVTPISYQAPAGTVLWKVILGEARRERRRGLPRQLLLVGRRTWVWAAETRYG